MDNKKLENLIYQLLASIEHSNQMYEIKESDLAKIDSLIEERSAIYQQLKEFETVALIEQGKILSQKIYRLKLSANPADIKLADTLFESYWYIVGILHERGTDTEYVEAQRLVLSNQLSEKIFAADILGQLAYQDKDKYYEYAVNKLIELLDSNDKRLIYSVAIALGHRLKNNDNRAVEKLAKLASHQDTDIRNAVAHGLTGNTSQLAIDTMIKLSRDESDVVRDWATFALSRQIDLDTPQIRQALHDSLSDKDFDVRGEALVGLSSRGDYTILDKLKQQLSGEYEARYTLEACINLGDNRLLPYLLKIQNKVKDLPCGHISYLDEAIEACQNSSKMI